MSLGTKAYSDCHQRKKERSMGSRKIHVVHSRRSVKNTNSESAKPSNDSTDSAERLRRIREVRKQLKDALRELDQIEIEVKGGCRW
jgi:hypothetical protein